MDGARWPAAQRALPQRRWALRGRQSRLGRRPAAPGSGCVAADFDLDGNTDLFVTTAGYNAATNGYDALLWGNGDGTFTEGARAAGINEPGWHSGAAVGDVNDDGRPTSSSRATPTPTCRCRAQPAGSPRTSQACATASTSARDDAGDAPASARSAGSPGSRPTQVDHGLGAVFTDVDDDGRLDLYVANDLDPNRLYLNKARPDVLGFAFVERGRRQRVDDPNAGMGIAAADYSRDGREDLFVTNSRRQLPRRLPQHPGGVRGRAPRLCARARD